MDAIAECDTGQGNEGDNVRGPDAGVLPLMMVQVCLLYTSDAADE